jgi:hypothetical protein
LKSKGTTEIDKVAFPGGPPLESEFDQALNYPAYLSSFRMTGKLGRPDYAVRHRLSGFVSVLLQFAQGSVLSGMHFCDHVEF